MAFNLTGYKIFIGSPGGLKTIRKSFKDTVEEYSTREAEPRDFLFMPVGWEETPGGIRRAQSLINEELRTCDYCVIVFHDHWGSNPGPSKYNATSGTEEEFMVALECLESDDMPMKDIIVIFKSVSTRQMADPGKELNKVLAFRKKLEQEKRVKYLTFSSKKEFERIILMHLSKWLRNNEGRSGDEDTGEPIDPIPISPQETDVVEISGSKKAENLVKKAKEYAQDGKLVDAEVSFSKALMEEASSFVLLSYSDFLILQGRLDQAKSMMDKASELAKKEKDEVNLSAALSRIGRFFSTRGDLEVAEEMYRKSLEINEKLGRQKGMAINYGNLGIVLEIRGDLEVAEEMYHKALEISVKCGFLQIQEQVEFWLSGLKK